MNACTYAILFPNNTTYPLRYCQYSYQSKYYIIRESILSGFGGKGTLGNVQNLLLAVLSEYMWCQDGARLNQESRLASS